MKAKLLPLFFNPGRDQAFDNQLSILRDLLALDAELLSPVALGSPLPEADAVIFPQLLGEGYRRAAEFQSISIPILVVTSAAALRISERRITEFEIGTISGLHRGRARPRPMPGIARGLIYHVAPSWR